MIVRWKNLYHAQELQKRSHNKGVKPKSYVFDDKVWLNSKYIKTKRNQKLEAKFFGPFRLLHLFEKQVYKLELLIEVENPWCFLHVNARTRHYQEGAGGQISQTNEVWCQRQ